MIIFLSKKRYFMKNDELRVRDITTSACEQVPTFACGRNAAVDKLSENMLCVCWENICFVEKTR